MHLIALAEADRVRAGGKAANLGALLRAGLPVPEGIVVPVGASVFHGDTGAALRQGLSCQLERWGHPHVAVRSSAQREDTADASAAGQYESTIGVHGLDEVLDAIATCQRSATGDRASRYWTRLRQQGHSETAGMAVLIQPVVPADASGVMFTAQNDGEPTRIEGSWGLGVSIVDGTVTPDAYEVNPDGTTTTRIGTKITRIDLHPAGSGLATTAVSKEAQRARVLDDAAVATLSEMGARVARILGAPQDVEWALSGDTVWILQARPITAAPPAMPSVRPLPTATSSGVLVGVSGSHGTVLGPVRVVRGPGDFHSVRAGDILVCRSTEPAWTPLFGLAAGIVTETGGVLSHAAIVAREYGIPAVLGVTHATEQLSNDTLITVDGAAGTVTIC